MADGDICLHTEQEHNICMDCGKPFDDADDWRAAQQQAIQDLMEW